MHIYLYLSEPECVGGGDFKPGRIVDGRDVDVEAEAQAVLEVARERVARVRVQRELQHHAVLRRLAAVVQVRDLNEACIICCFHFKELL